MKFRNLVKLLGALMVVTSLIPTALAEAGKSYLVGFKQRPGPAEHALIHHAKGAVKRSFRLIPAVVAELSEQEVEKLRSDENVSYVEEDGLVMAMEIAQDQEYLDSWGVSHIRADEAHLSGNYGQGVKIAVVDTGIDYSHPDLDDNYKGGYDFVYDDDDPFDDNWQSHGTHVAGILAAEANGLGMVGVAPQAELYALKVLDGAGYGVISWVIAALEWAVEQRMDLVNLSLGLTYHDQSLQDACDRAYEAGVLLVAAAGNYLTPSLSIPVMYPGAYDSVVAVTATTQDDLNTWFAPLGPEIELSAPGLQIWSTAGDGGYQYSHGTSEAAPYVTGTAALFLAAGMDDVNGDGFTDNRDLRLMLQATAKDLGDPGRDSLFGFGLVDAGSALWPSSQSMFLTITRSSRSRWDNSATVSLSDAPFEITVTSHGLRTVRMGVFENGILQRELGSLFMFKERGKKAVKLTDLLNRERASLDATGRTFDVVFTPQGKRGAYADIEISSQGIGY